ncbi:MAG: cyclase family protein [Promethearchaeota archaeon]
MFDLKDYEIIDISHTVVPGEDADRPFAIQKALLQDKTFRYDILKTHSHVGCHVEVGAHFYENGKSITDYPLERFYGPGVLLSVKEMIITGESCEKLLGNKIEEGDIVVIRNDTGIKFTKQQLYMEGEDIEETRQFHDILMSLDVNFVEFVDNLDKITQERFFVMALPYKVQGLDSSFCRAIVIQEK